MKRLLPIAWRPLVAALLLCFFCCLGALAENAIVAEATRGYTRPDTASASVKLSAGTQVELLAERSGWAQIRLKGKTGYVKAAALVKVTTYSGKTVYAAENAPAYKNWGSSKKLGVVPAGTELKLHATAGDWACVQLGGKKGFMRSSALTTERPAAAPEATATPATAPTSKKITAYAASDGVKAYSSWSTSSGVLATLSQNTAVTVTAVKDGWCRVEAGGRTAYIRKSELSATKTTETQPAAAEEPQQAELRYGDTGDAVKALQKRLKELGYFTGEIGGNYKEQTQTAVKAFQAAAKLPETGAADAATLKALAADSAPKAPQPTGNSTVTPARGTAREMDWWTSGIQTIFARETVAQVTDIETGISWRVIRKGGANHADVQPCTAADTAAMKKACGGWSWNRRAIWVTINGVNYAASMNCMPHGSGSITTNNFPGHHCIHFTNSRTHGSNRVCPLHQAAIKKAAAAKR